MYYRLFTLSLILLLTPDLAFSTGYNLSKLKHKYFKSLFPPVNHLTPSPADYTFVGEWIRRKGKSASDYNIKVKTIVYKKTSHHLVYIKFKRHGKPFCWWFSKATEGKPPKGWVEGACYVNNDGIYEEVWDRNAYESVNWNFCKYWNCESY